MTAVIAGTDAGAAPLAEQPRFSAAFITIRISPVDHATRQIVAARLRPGLHLIMPCASSTFVFPS